MVLERVRELVRGGDGRPAIVVDRLAETFRLYHQRPSGLKERLYRFRRTSYTDFNALDDVSFTVDHGESVEVIGHNGSGKSTLLKVLARILEPDAGAVEINGRLASLLELGAGFHGDLSGRENIYLNGAILGLSRAEIDACFDEIVDFAGIRPLLDTAVRTYSSGLYVRLGFAIAVMVDPDVLLVDEVLSVGDEAFQQRSLERMQAFSAAGKTIVIVSHDLDTVASLCDRAIVLDRGRLAFDGSISEGVALYRQQITSGERRAGRATGGAASLDARRGGTGTGASARALIDAVTLFDGDDVVTSDVAPSTPLRLRVALRASDGIDACSVTVRVVLGDGTPLHEVATAWHGVAVGPLRPADTATVDVRFVAHLLAGHYRIDVRLTDAAGRVTWAVAPDAARFDVRPAAASAGLVDLRATSSVVEGPALRLERGGDSGEIRAVPPPAS